MSNTAEISVREVIVSHISTRGLGTKRSPCRKVLQVFEKDGTLIAEKDDWDGDKFTQGDLVNFAIWCLSYDNSRPVYSDVEKWLSEIENKK